MCPAPVYSYFDAQILADFIMNSQFPGYDGTNSTAASSESAFGQLGSMAASFVGASTDDYDSYDNARARKRRMTVSDDRRVEDLSNFNMPDVSDGLFGMLDQHQGGYAGAMHQHQQSGGGHMASGSTLSSLPIPPGTSDDPSSLNAALTGGMAFNGLTFPQNPYASSVGSDINSPHHLHQHANSLSSPPISSRAAAGGRKHQSLSIAINRANHSRNNELSGQEPHTPGMFSPSFMDAMEGAAAAVAAGMSSPMFYSVATPYTPIHAHHHSFSMPSGAQQGHSAGGMFHPGLSVGAFGGSEAASLDHNSGSLGSVGSTEDFSAGLQISMNAAMAAAMSNAGSYDDSSSHHRSGSSASAFSRVQQGASGVSQMLSGGQPNGGLNMDIGTTLASFTNIPGLEPFPSASMERRQTFASGDHHHHHHHHNSTPFGMLSTEPSSMFHSMDVATAAAAAAALHSSAGAPLMGIANSLTHEGLLTSPSMESANGLQSPAAAARRSRKRAATVSAIHNDDHPHHHQHSPSSATSLMSVNMHGGMLMTRASSDSSAYTGPVFNSQAVVTGTGSKVVMVLTSKVAQKSYGTEKRFLCPPPTILLFGDDWKLPTAAGDGSAHGNDFFASMPRISVSVPTSDGSSQVSDFGEGLSGSSSSDSRTALIEWLARPELGPKPKQHIPHNPVPPMRAPRDGDPITGRYVAKQLFINDVDEKRKRVAVKVRLHDPSGHVVLNEFESRPIKVISKPSKKRQSVKNIDLCIHHGSTISLFNRLRSQTVSTKYLGATRSMSVGGPRPFWFPAGGAEESAAADSLAESTGSSAATTTFVARNSVWDPFIIWIVNTQLDQAEIEAFNDRIAENPTPIPGYPTPPTFALHPQCPPDLDSGCMSVSGSGSSNGDQSHMDSDAIGQPQPREPIPILYNQPIILQCVSTGMCSPVLTLRKVEKGSIAIGSFYGRDQTRDVLGDPVSQLHKVAFEVRVQTREELPAVTVTPAGLNTRVGSYLTCMGDIVGLNATCDGRQLTGDGAESSSGAKSAARGSPASQAARKQAKDCASAGTSSWAEDVGDNAVWTMVGTDCAIYRFDYPPTPDVMSQLHQANVSTSSAATASTASTIMPLRTSMTLPPTPTSPHGVQDYSQHNKLQQQQQHQPFSLEMMLAEHGATGGFQSVGMDASLAAAVYGIGMGSGVNDSLPPQLLSSSMLAAAAAAAASNGHGDLAHQGGQHQQQHSYGSNEGRGMHMASDNNSVPIVFKSSVQNPPTISPSTFFGGDSGAAPATERSYITLHGLNFTPDMVVVFDGQHSLFTEFKSSESISCLGPLATDFADDSAAEDTVVAASNDNSGDDDDYHMEEYAMLDGSKRQQGQHPTSPSESDSSLAANSSSAQSSVDSANKPRSLRASSTDSTASSATATLSSHGSSAPLKKSGAAASRGSLAKRSGSVVKVPIYLSRNGGAGPTFKTGQFYTLQM
ncbi:hypothetical protein LPJ60_000444 [Coemansia sp. RSA 2675]|nr:hypothetical protein LPJ60_000444 [Coemansia sp. RSA 2675]